MNLKDQQDPLPETPRLKIYQRTKSQAPYLKVNFRPRKVLCSQKWFRTHNLQKRRKTA